jgi:hypothetical protein
MHTSEAMTDDRLHGVMPDAKYFFYSGVTCVLL